MRYDFETRITRENLLIIKEKSTGVKIMQGIRSPNMIAEQIQSLKETIKQIIDENITD